MAVTKVFQSGNSQAVRIPKELRLNAKEVEIFRRGDEIVLRERRPDLTEAFDLLTQLSPDIFEDGRCQPEQPEREDL